MHCRPQVDLITALPTMDPAVWHCGELCSGLSSPSSAVQRSEYSFDSLGTPSLQVGKASRGNGVFVEECHMFRRQDPRLSAAMGQAPSEDVSLLLKPCTPPDPPFRRRCTVWSPVHLP